MVLAKAAHELRQSGEIDSAIGDTWLRELAGGDPKTSVETALVSRVARLERLVEEMLAQPEQREHEQ